jgi:hypothetical protein
MDHVEAERWMKSIWPHKKAEEFPQTDYHRVIEFMKAQKRSATTEDNSFTENVVSQMSFLIEKLGKIDRCSLTKNAVALVVTESFPGIPYSAESLSKSIDLMLRLMLTLDVRSSSDRNWPSRVLSSHVTWVENMSLSEAISLHFKPSTPNGPDMTTGRIDPAMTMAHLSHFGGLKVIWTSNLADHLVVNWKSRVMTVYEHKICLWNHLNSSAEPIIPREILEEALDTLNLLFPLNDTRTKEFLQQNGKPFYGLGYCKRDRVYDVGRFYFWRDSIAELMEIMNEGPRGLQQLALSKDGKNAMTFATFWVATLVAILTIISIAFGTVQTVYSIKQYRLAVAQACAAPGAKEALAGYCS